MILTNLLSLINTDCKTNKCLWFSKNKSFDCKIYGWMV